MADPYVGEIRMFAGNFAPVGWALCQGQLVAISSNDALFSLIGVYYGGDGETTFGLPDLRGRIPVHMGSGPGLTTRNIGAKSGTETETANLNHTNHAHGLAGTSLPANTSDPGQGILASGLAYAGAGANMSEMHSDAIGESGVDSPASHNNLQPFLCVNFIIALFGVYPSEN